MLYEDWGKDKLHMKKNQRQVTDERKQFVFHLATSSFNEEDYKKIISPGKYMYVQG